MAAKTIRTLLFPCVGVLADVGEKEKRSRQQNGEGRRITCFLLDVATVAAYLFTGAPITAGKLRHRLMAESLSGVPT
jgi:hypothetical protein